MEKFDLTNWAETHHEVVLQVHRALENELKAVGTGKPEPNSLLYFQEEQGRGYMWELCIDITKKFEEKHKETEWDGDFFDTLEVFVIERLNNLKS